MVENQIMRNKKTILVGLACLGTIIAAPTLAEDLILFEENGGANGPRGLYDLDSDTGNITLRTTVAGSERIFSMTTDPSTGDVYAMDPAAERLYTIDVDTGVISTIGDISGISSFMADITFDSGGTLWGLDRDPPQTLYKVDLDTLTVIPQGNTTHVCAGLTWLDGTLYGFNLKGTLFEIDPNTGNDTPIGGGGGDYLIEDATAGADGMLYFTDWAGDVFRVNPSGGSKTGLVNTGNGTGCLGIIGEQPTPPTCITLSNDGLVAGQSTLWEITGATPGQNVVVVYGTQSGQTAVSGTAGFCATFGIEGVNQSRLIGNPKAATSQGYASWKKPIPSKYHGVRILTQGAGAGTCPDDCQSNLLDQVVG